MTKKTPNRIFIFPSCFEHPRQFIDAHNRECLAFDNLQAQTIPQNSVVADSEYVNIIRYGMMPMKRPSVENHVLLT